MKVARCVGSGEKLVRSAMESVSLADIHNMSDLGRASLKRFSDDKGGGYSQEVCKKQRDNCAMSRRSADFACQTQRCGANDEVPSDSPNKVNSHAERERTNPLIQEEAQHSSLSRHSDILVSQLDRLTRTQQACWSDPIRTSHGRGIRCLSFPDLGVSCEHRPAEMDMSGQATEVQCEQEVIRCRSLPCRMSPDNNVRTLHTSSVSVAHQSVRLSQFFTDKITDKLTDKDSEESQSRESDNAEDKINSTCASPSSCFIDVEDDPVCSPLNLALNDIELPKNTCVRDELPAHCENRLEAAKNLDKLSSFVRLTKHRNVPENRTEKKSQDGPVNEKLNEKKTNFSIDDILRPDFGAARTDVGVDRTDVGAARPDVGAARTVSQASTTSFQRFKVQSLRPRFGNSIRSSHSAFTAVDLSTRSRSDSLSSPSCSSCSSPSPPLPSSSSPTPSAQHKPEFNHVGAYDKHFLGQENFFFSSQILTETNKGLDNYFNGHVPFFNSLHGNGMGHFPFLYSSQTSPESKTVTKKDYFLQQSENVRSKSDVPNNDISKLFSRSLYPFVAGSHSNRSDALKLSRHHGDQSKAGSDVTVLRQNKQTSSTKSSSTIDDSRESSFDSHTSQTRTRIPSGDQDKARNCKIALKHERSGQGDSDSSRKSDNPTWPAWVFCTRYSDRPSSGPRSRKPKRSKGQDEKRPRTAFTNDQLVRLKREFEDCRYLTEARRKSLADELGLTESQIKIWFQNKRAKIKKSTGVINTLALQLMEQGLYNHSTVKVDDDSN